MDDRKFSTELIMILAIAIAVLATLLLIALSKMCCSILTLYSEYRSTERLSRTPSTASAATASPGASEFGSAVKSEKLALIDRAAWIESQTGIRLDDYPFAVDYDAPLLPPADPLRDVAGFCREPERMSQSDNGSQVLGSDSPGSDSFPDTRTSSISEDDLYQQSVLLKTESEGYLTSPDYSSDRLPSPPSPASPSLSPPTSPTGRPPRPPSLSPDPPSANSPPPIPQVSVIPPTPPAAAATSAPSHLQPSNAHSPPHSVSEQIREQPAQTCPTSGSDSETQSPPDPVTDSTQAPTPDAHPMPVNRSDAQLNMAAAQRSPETGDAKAPKRHLTL